jgi:hypothetical protein
MTPNGLADSACVFEVPNGAIVDASGDVKVSEAVVDHHAPCSPEQMGSASQAARAPGNVLPTITGWVEWSNANATNIDGVAYYNGLFANWTVPNNPGFNEVIFLFPSFQSSNEIV